MIENAYEASDIALMGLALEEARLAEANGDVPVGAVAVLAGAIVARQHNRKEAWADPTAHAELLVLREAADRLGRWRLPDITVYATMEPCAMCAGAMVQARLVGWFMPYPTLAPGPPAPCSTSWIIPGSTIG